MFTVQISNVECQRGMQHKRLTCYSFWCCFRIFRQPQGHLLLIGVSGAGKTTLSRFVAWMNGLSVYQIKVGMLVAFSPRSRLLVPGHSSLNESRPHLPTASAGP